MLWKRRQSTEFNGVPYITQRAAQAALSQKGYDESQKSVAYYKQNAQLVLKVIKSHCRYCGGGKNSPYIWISHEKFDNSWDFSDALLYNAGVVVIPGAGFGKNGEGYIRLSAFCSREDTYEAVERLDGFFASL